MILQYNLKTSQLQQEIDLLNRMADLVGWFPEDRHIDIKLWSDGDYSICVDSFRDYITIRHRPCDFCGKEGISLFMWASNHMSSSFNERVLCEKCFIQNHSFSSKPALVSKRGRADPDFY